MTAKFPGLSRKAFQHPEDVKALETLQGFKGVDLVCHKLVEMGFERAMLVQSIASDIKTSPRQFPIVHDLVRAAADCLDLEAPTVFVAESPFMNAYTIGVERPFVVLNSRLVQLLTEEELYAVVAHELGHIKCGHVLYGTMAKFLAMFAEGIAAATLGLGGLVSLGLQVAIANWYQKAELSCDRAGLIACGDPDISTSALLKLSGATAASSLQISTDEFLAQAEEYDKMDRDGLDKFYKLVMTVGRSHPYTAVRAREIRAWSASDEYRRILEGSYEQGADEPIVKPDWFTKLEEAGRAASPGAAQTIKSAEEAAAAAGAAAAEGIKVLTEVVGRVGGMALDALQGGLKSVLESAAAGTEAARPAQPPTPAEGGVVEEPGPAADKPSGDDAPDDPAPGKTLG
ncbi:MAG: M48 family metallopeptidase [Candidatus Sericytochromatia bacterium]|nr:M48 family metallopeptidase [Candidatus Tanganyikabacteria bacterium]